MHQHEAHLIRGQGRPPSRSPNNWSHNGLVAQLISKRPQPRSASELSCVTSAKLQHTSRAGNIKNTCHNTFDFYLWHWSNWTWHLLIERGNSWRAPRDISRGSIVVIVKPIKIYWKINYTTSDEFRSTDFNSTKAFPWDLPEDQSWTARPRPTPCLRGSMGAWQPDPLVATLNHSTIVGWIPWLKSKKIPILTRTRSMQVEDLRVKILLFTRAHICHICRRKWGIQTTTACLFNLRELCPRWSIHTSSSIETLPIFPWPPVIRDNFSSHYYTLPCYSYYIFYASYHRGSY